jgi:hypothetical protein
MGSGRWYRWRKKSTVEASLSIGIGDFRGRLYHGFANSIAWTWGSGNKSSIGYFVDRNDAGLTIVLHYRWGDTEDVRIPVRLQATRTNFNGKRWWFTCPLIVGGVVCNRRVGQLHLPPGARYFGCRHCHDLTYQSCQTAHQAERLFARFDRGLGMDAAVGNSLAALSGGQKSAE